MWFTMIGLAMVGLGIGVTRKFRVKAPVRTTPPLDIENGMHTSNDGSKSELEASLQERATSKYEKWIQECRDRVGVLGDPISEDIVVADSKIKRIKLELDTRVHLSIWIDGPEWMGPYPRTSSDLWVTETHLTAEDTPQSFEEMLLLARAKQTNKCV